MQFFYVDSSGELVCHRLRTVPLPIPAEGVKESAPVSSNLDISSLNPFKSASSESVNVPNSVREESRIQLDPIIRLGVLGTLDVDGMRLRFVQPGQFQGVFWSSDHLFVSMHSDIQMTSPTSSSASRVMTVLCLPSPRFATAKT